MTRTTIHALSAAALVAALGGTAHAQDVTVSFSGTLEAVENSPYAIAVGTAFTGYYTYNLTTPNTSPFRIWVGT